MDMPAGGSVALACCSTSENPSLRLLEVDAALAAQILETGAVIKGLATDDAVLCTASKTYHLKFVRTSNTLLLALPEATQAGAEGPQVQDSGSDLNVTFISPGHLEVKEAVPRSEHLRSLLSASSAKGGCTWETIVTTIQASEGELRAALSSLNAINRDGKWLLIAEEDMQRAVEMLILTAVEHGWALSELPSDELIADLARHGFPEDLIRHCLRRYGRQSPADASGNVWSIDPQLIALHRAKQLLGSGSRWRVDDFLKAWSENLSWSGSHEFSLDLLRGEVVIEGSGSERWLRPLSIGSLPASAQERFAALFKEKPRWEWQEMEPFLRGLEDGSLSLQAIALKYARRSQMTPTSPVYFSAR